MEFRAQAVAVDALSKNGADALVIVLAGEAKDQHLDAPLAALLKEAIASGDLVIKAGRTLCLHRPAAVKAARVVFSVAADHSAKAFKTAVGAALGLLKQGGATQVAVLHAGASADAAHAEALTAAAGDAVYVYRHTKPSAAPASALKKLTLLVPAAGLKAAQQGLVRGAAIGAGVELARECANRPANHATPSHLADLAKGLAKAHGFKVEVLDRKDVEKLGMGSFLAVAQGSDEPLKFIVLRHDGGPKGQAPVVLSARASPLTPAASRSSPRPRWTR